MQSGGVLTLKVALPWWRYNTDQKEMDFYLRLLIPARAGMRVEPAVALRAE